jgi:hypothetical protein
VSVTSSSYTTHPQADGRVRGATANADAAEATYEIALTITATGGRIKTVCFKVRVKDC